MSDIDRERPTDDVFDLELDRAIDALNRDRRPDLGPHAPDAYREAVEGAMLLRSTEPPSPPDSDFVASLAARLASTALTPTANGQAEFRRIDTQPLHGASLWRSVLMPATQAAGACALAGAIAGVVVGGVGGRLVMLVSGEMYRREHPHMRIRTESSGRLVGDFTWSGTFELIGQGMVLGLIGGLIYLVARRWLPRSSRYEGLLFGVLLLLLAGVTVISADNADFDRFGSPVVNVLMFASLFVLYGMAVGPLARWSARLASRRRGQSGVIRFAIGSALALMGGLGLLIVVLMVAFGVVELRNALQQLGSSDASLSTGLTAVAIGAAIVMLPATRGLVALLERGLVRVPVSVSTVDAIGRWTLWIAVVAGASLTLSEIASIVGLA
jgi:hypothetical protein